MIKDQKQRETVALVRNKLYRTYQFHGIVGKGKNPDHVFKTVISQIFLWLSDRFRQFEEVPEQIRTLCDASKINDSSLQPFHINDGYIIETAYLQEDNSWSFCLTEPDTGTSERDPVPGRLFVTNFALRIMNDAVELGCKTLCSQPECIQEDAEVFRPKLIRDLKDGLGLWEFLDLSYEAGNLEDGNAQRKFDAVFKFNERNMPIIVIERKKPCFSENTILKNEDYLGGLLKPKFDMVVLETVANQSKKQIDWVLSSNQIAKSLCGFAYVFRNLSGAQNQIKVFAPGGTVEVIDLPESLDETQESQIRRMVIDKIRLSPKRNEKFGYGNIIFLQESIAIKQERELERLKHSENCLEEIKELYSINTRLIDEKVREEQKNRDCFQKLNEEKKGRQAEELSYNDKLRQMAREMKNLEKENNNLKDQLKAITVELEAFQARESRPDNAEQLIHWIDKYFGEDVILLARAKDEIKKAKNCSVDLMCDGIEVLAKAYRQWRLGHVSEEQYNCNCKSLCKTSFEITHTGDASIKRYPKDYKVPYDDPFALEHGGKRVLDQHLKYGVDSKFLLRIYFFWDEKLERVVIGSMPEHLRSV
jgi:hypothetical protein